IARIHRSNQQCQQADQNLDHQQTVNEDVARKAQCHSRKQPEPAPETPETLEHPQNPFRISSLQLLNLNSNHVYETVPIPEGVTLITSKPIFHIKCNHTKNVKHYQVCIITWGFTQ
ncbi:hypothetical protein PAXRUDRAFT_139385, partial [Paxillus rubicundulus Ve08.2h10]